MRGQGLQQQLVRADGPQATVTRAVPDETLFAALQALRHSKTPAVVEKLEQYDDLYYARRQDASTPLTRPLPVWRAHWAADGVAVYADPASARIVLRTDANTPWQRLLYHGLHSLDFAPLLARPALRTGLVLVLSALGMVLCVTSCVLAWRVFSPVRHSQRARTRTRWGARGIPAPSATT